MPEPRRKLALAAAPEPEPPQPASDEVRLDVSAQLITLEPGLFSVELHADDAAMTEAGMVLPSARIDPLPPNGEARAYLSTLSETPLLLPGTHPAFLRVARGRVPVLLTIYKLAGAPPPRLRITTVKQDGAPGPATRATPTASSALPSLPLTITAHLAGHGDITAPGGAWAEAPTSQAAIEGFAITLGAPIDGAELEYQAVLGQDWVSPWMPAGEFCGSRQLALALLGVRVRLRGPRAARYRCHVWGRFDGQEIGPAENGDACESNGAALQALRVAITERPR